MKLLFISIFTIILIFQSEKVISENNISAEIIQKKVPLFIGTSRNHLLDLIVRVGPETDVVKVNQFIIHFSTNSKIDCLTDVSVELMQNSKTVAFGASQDIATELIIAGDSVLNNGENIFSFHFKTKMEADLLSTFQVEQIDISYNKNQILKVKNESTLFFHLAKILREPGNYDCDTYRIPGLITTQNGTLIAVYDNRYNRSKDLQEDIDIGMRRSIDGGQTWESLKVIMDMGEWGGLPNELNGVGDPCVLYDNINNNIWVAGLWLHGLGINKTAWLDSKPGLKPSETGQFLLVKSNDDGLTWSQPINITEQIKDPEWQLLLQCPGKGICMSNGTLVFPAQFKKDIGDNALDGGKYTGHSTIVYSTNGGNDWEIGTGAKTNTTEAQVVELSDGSLMLNMRDYRNLKNKEENNGRAVAITNDLGKTWNAHPSTNSALPEPHCMASLIATKIELHGEVKNVLFFSNPNNKFKRKNITIKASLDEGKTWPKDYQLELNEMEVFGYSCLTMIDEYTIGILHEGVKEIYFQKIRVNDVLKLNLFQK